ncbi:hypothetical protein K8R04_04210 [Candidatus Uhrbacteria bacterium]|nr:hypothetical protein [Candidatus Uhrbacteria bacterium]
MKKNLLFVAVMIALAANEAEARAKNWPKTASDMREAFWRKYDSAVFRLLDELEARNIYRQESHGDTKS